jgi:hypothetical protein
MKDDDLKKKFQEQLSNKLKAIGAQKKTVNEKYNEFTEHVKTLSGAIFNQERNKSRKPKEWLTDEILNLVNEKQLRLSNGKTIVRQGWKENIGTNTVY